MRLNRKNKPTEISNIKFTLPLPEEFCLDNGLKVIFIRKTNLPIIKILMNINAGSKFDNELKKGLSHLTTLTIDEGAGGISALDLSDEFDMLGIDFGLSANKDQININLQSLSEHFERSIELFSKVILSPDFTGYDFEREKKKLLIRILQSKDKPDYAADQIFRKIIFSNDNPYAFPIIGYTDTVSSLTRDDVRKFYADFFYPKNSTLIAAGNIDTENLKNILNKYLKDWTNDGSVKSIRNNFAATKKNIYVYHKDDAVQTEIRIGHLSEPRNKKNYFPRLLLNTILGGQFTSRINLNLRERNGYTYGATSRFNYFKDAAFFEVSTSCGVENTANAVNEILFELEQIKSGIKDSELEFAKSSITKRFPLSFETYGQLTSGLSGRVLFDLSPDYFSNYVDNVNSVSKAEVNQAANYFINNNALTIVLVGDKTKIIQQIQNLGVGIYEVDLYGNVQI
ncbi:MAG: insulinase family protein [Ignavibacteriales bacterium]|nr:insulinase family protein [Ignavibacteriales bacterium]